MRRAPLAVSIGDPAGVGPDVLISAWQQREKLRLPPFFVIADPGQIAERSSRLGVELAISVYDPETCAIPDNGLPVVATGATARLQPGKPHADNAALAIEAIGTGVAMTLEGDASGLVTLPIHKKSLYEIGFSFPGHTEYLAHLAAAKTGSASKPVMMLAGPGLRAVPATIHIPFAEVGRFLTRELLEDTIRTVEATLRLDFGIEAPRIAVSGLNPHAGEEGTMGREEIEIIAPAIEALRAQGLLIRGPLPADTMFHAAARKTYDAAVCMYHDQALIPAKMLAFDESVNVTLGLPFVRTSPDHGTAFNIAGTGKANPASFIEALRLADQMAEKRISR